jgi:DnaK suppressor protein
MELTTADRATLREHIESRIEEIRTSLLRETGGSSAVTPDNAIGRLTRLDAMQAGKMTEELRRQRQAELTRLEAALRRVDEEEFGVCAQCEEPIAMTRLLARPDARMCVGCAERAEQRE